MATIRDDKTVEFNHDRKLSFESKRVKALLRALVPDQGERVFVPDEDGKPKKENRVNVDLKNAIDDVRAASDAHPYLTFDAFHDLERYEDFPVRLVAKYAKYAEHATTKELFSPTKNYLFRAYDLCATNRRHDDMHADRPLVVVLNVPSVYGASPSTRCRAPRARRATSSCGPRTPITGW